MFHDDGQTNSYDVHKMDAIYYMIYDHYKWFTTAIANFRSSNKKKTEQTERDVTPFT